MKGSYRGLPDKAMRLGCKPRTALMDNSAVVAAAVAALFLMGVAFEYKRSWLGDHMKPVWIPERLSDAVHDREPKYHLYDPSDLLMYSQCNRSQVHDPRHSQDWQFIKALLEDGNSVPPEEAELFVVPALMSQSYGRRNDGICGDHDRNLDDLTRFLHNSQWFKRSNGSDHLIIADSWRVRSTARTLPGAMMYGAVECRSRSNRRAEHPCIKVGMTTYQGLVNAGALPKDQSVTNIPPLERKYDVAFIDVETHSKATSRYRIEAACSWRQGGQQRHSYRFFFHIRGAVGDNDIDCDNMVLQPRDEPKTARSASVAKPMPSLEVRKVMADSTFFLALEGDTLTNEHLYNMFDTLTIPIVVYAHFKDLLNYLPFPRIVNWEKLFVVVPDEAWAEDPIQSVIDAVDSVSLEQVQHFHDRIEDVAPMVSYAWENSRAHNNILHAAWYEKQWLESLRLTRGMSTSEV